MNHWQDAGAAVPVAIVVSVFDDVLLEMPESVEESEVGLDAIAVDDAGHAFTRCPMGLKSAGRLLVRALGDDVPSNAQPLVARLLDGDRPADAEQLRQWMRDALGAPASREEVCAAFTAASHDPTEAETLLPAPAPADTGDLEVDSVVAPEPLDDEPRAADRVAEDEAPYEASRVEDAREVEAVVAAEADASEAVAESNAPEVVASNAPEAVAESDASEAVAAEANAPEAVAEANAPEAVAESNAPEVAEANVSEGSVAEDDAALSAPPLADEDAETLPPLPVPPLADDDELYAVAGEASLPPERYDTTIDSRPPNVSIAAEAAPVSIPAEAAPVSIPAEAAPVSIPAEASPSSVAAATEVAPEPVVDGADAVEAHSIMPPSDVAPIPGAPMSDESSQSNGRRVVRYEYSPPSVAVSSAPAARRSARAAAAGPDSILVPNERRGSLAWLVLLAAIGAAVYFLFFS